MPRQTKEAGREITFKYIFDNNYNPVYANGVHGGITPSGQLVLNFYFERHCLPDSVTHKVDQDGKLGEEIKEKSVPSDLNNSYARFVESGVILDLSVATKVRDFIDKYIAKFDDMQSKPATKK